MFYRTYFTNYAGTSKITIPAKGQIININTYLHTFINIVHSFFSATKLTQKRHQKSVFFTLSQHHPNNKTYAKKESNKHIQFYVSTYCTRIFDYKSPIIRTIFIVLD